MQALDGTVLAPPTVANGLVYTATLTGLHIFDAHTGELLWQDPTGTSQYGQVAVVDGVVYATYVDGSVRAWTVDRTP
jgi:outer membrane protein assembly factor BamB